MLQSSDYVKFEKLLILQQKVLDYRESKLITSNEPKLNSPLKHALCCTICNTNLQYIHCYSQQEITPRVHTSIRRLISVKRS